MFGNIDVAKQLFHVMPEVADPKLEHHFRFVHRLDFATSGVLCLGLKRKAAGKAAIKFQQRLVTKHYSALVRNTVYRLDERSELTISAAIGRDKTEDARHIMTTADNPNCESPRPCKTKMVLLETGKYDGEPASKVLLIPETGRTHQLRVHCRHVGHQIVGDYAYSNRTDVKPYRMMLHAFRLVIPLQNEHIDVVAPDPFTPETDKLWQPDKVVRTYDDYVKDQDFKKTLSSGKKTSPGRKPKHRNIRDGTTSSAPCTTGDFDGATNTAVSVTGDSNRSSNSGPSAGHGASQTPIVKM
ncbi:RNA pseudouridylate synthase domain-containing protein 1-like isoform X2 [Lineus longissimus]